MEEEYPEVVSKWERATMEMESLPLQLERKIEQKRQILDKLEKISKESKEKFLQEEKSLHKEKSLLKENSIQLEQEIDFLKSKILNAPDSEKNAQTCLSKEVLSDASTQFVQRTCRQKMEFLQRELKSDRSKRDATIKQLEVSNNHSENDTLRAKLIRLAEKIEHYELDIKTKSKVLILFNILQPAISVEYQWFNAVRNSKALTPRIEMWCRKLEELPVPKLMVEKQQKQKYVDKIKDLKLEQEKEMEKISIFETSLSKIVLDPSCETKRIPQVHKENIPAKQSTQIVYKRETIRKIEKNNDRKDDTYKKGLGDIKLEGNDLSGVGKDQEICKNKQKDFKLADTSVNDSERLIESNEEKLQDDGMCSEGNNDKEQKVQPTEDKHKREHIVKKIIDNETENENNQNENNQNESKDQQKNTKSAENDCGSERFQNEYGIIIESISTKNLSYKAEPWNSDERLDILESKEFPDGFTLHTDIFQISESTAEIPRDGKVVSAQDVRFKVLLPTKYSSYYEYKGAIKVGKDWTLIDGSIKDGYMVFEVDQVESFCVLSLVRQEKHVILPAGSQFISEIDNRIQVIFPPNAVTKEEHITFKIHPVNISCILERTSESIDNSISINAITPGISTSHMNFKKMFKVQLPLNSISKFCGNTEDYRYYIFKWNDDGSFELTDLQPMVNNELVCFQAISFSGYGCVGAPGSTSTSSHVSVLPEAYSLMKWCKILFFVGKLKKYTLPILLECVDLQRVSDTCAKREKYGYQLVPEWISKDFFLYPYKTIITVDVKGMFRISKDSGVKHPKLSFVPVARDNFTRFLVELKIGGIEYGVLVLRENRTILDEICYDPETTKNIPDKRIGNRVNPAKRKSVKIAQPLIVRNSIVRDFFTEKGLLALSKSMSPETMLEVCINMDMTTSTYDTIQQKYGVGTTRGNIALWKTAFDQHPKEKKLENLITALTAASQKSLADRVQQLYSRGKDLHTISSSESV